MSCKFHVNTEMQNIAQNTISNNSCDLIRTWSREVDHFEGRQISSTGMGLSISRIISKSLGGDCGIFFNADTNDVTFWICIKYKKVPDVIVAV